MNNFLPASLAFLYGRYTVDEFAEVSSVLQTGVPPDRLVNQVSSPRLRAFLMSQADWWRQVEKVYQELQRSGAKFVTWADDDYPFYLRWTDSPPLILTYRGEMAWRHNLLLSIVGSRQSSPVGRQWLERHICQAVKALSLVTVSGAARGIDQAAHGASLRLGLPTIAFLPSGLNNTYPQCFTDWQKPILNCGGAIVSEFAPEVKMNKWHFHKRNRLIAGISLVTLVVEARRRSGTVMTANLAAALGRSVAALPGAVDCPPFAGNVDLLHDGAHLIRDAEDLALLVYSEYSRRAAQRPNSQT